MYIMTCYYSYGHESTYLSAMSYYKNKTVWITGASAGIGAAMALALSKKGARLILSSRKKEALEKVALACQPANCEVVPLDLEDHEGLDRVLAMDLLQDVDILINNGGISQRSKVVDTAFSVYKKLMDINYLGTVKLSLGILPHFVKKNEGQFVVISSMAGKFGVPIRSGYSASKMALHGFFDAMRAELKDTKIKVTMVCPGYIQTDISKNALTATGSAQGTMDEAQRNGMDVHEMVSKVLDAVAAQKEEIHIGGLKEVKLAGIVSRVFPATFRKIIAKSKVT